MIQQLIAGILRHVLTVLGGGLVTQGYLDANELSAGVGAVLTIFGIGWSIWQKMQAKKAAALSAKSVGGEDTAATASPTIKPVAPAVKRALNPNNKGFIDLGLLLRMLLVLVVVAVFFWLGKWASADNGDVANTAATSLSADPAPYISYGLVEDERPFLLRLFASPKLWTEAGRDTRWRIDEYGLRAKGQDAQGRLGVDMADVALGIKFGTDF